jgi:pilus assembly protein Flp/PilA
MEYFRLMLLGLNVDKRAVTAIEYALIASLIAVVLIGGATTLGGALSNKFVNISDAL